MSHARTQIRDALRDALRGLGPTGERVFTDRPFGLNLDEMPGLVVAALGESSTDSTMGDVKQDRVLRLVVAGYAKGELLEAELDAIAVEVEERVFAGWPLGVGVKGITYVGAALDMEDGAPSVGEIELTFDVMYRTAEGAPEIIVP